MLSETRQEKRVVMEAGFSGHGSEGNRGDKVVLDRWEGTETAGEGGTLGYIRGEEGGHGRSTAYAEDAI